MIDSWKKLKINFLVFLCFEFAISLPLLFLPREAPNDCIFPSQKNSISFSKV